eukprot:SAG31_NODE_6989_length_1826_cov_1.482339_3_plen_122_part_00
MQPASGSAPLHVCGSGSFSTEVRDSRKEKTSGASAILLAVVSVLLTAVLVVMCYIAYQMTVLTPHIVKLSAFVDHHGTERKYLAQIIYVEQLCHANSTIACFICAVQLEGLTCARPYDRSE